jgi:hypothetical protein
MPRGKRQMEILEVLPEMPQRKAKSGTPEVLGFLSEAF